MKNVPFNTTNKNKEQRSGFYPELEKSDLLDFVSNNEELALDLINRAATIRFQSLIRDSKNFVNQSTLTHNDLTIVHRGVDKTTALLTSFSEAMKKVQAGEMSFDDMQKMFAIPDKTDKTENK